MTRAPFSIAITVSPTLLPPHSQELLMTRSSFVVAIAFVLGVAPSVRANFISVSKVGNGAESWTRSTTPAEYGSATQPAPQMGDVHQFQVTTDGDILSVNNIKI